MCNVFVRLESFCNTVKHKCCNIHNGLVTRWIKCKPMAGLNVAGRIRFLSSVLFNINCIIMNATQSDSGLRALYCSRLL